MKAGYVYIVTNKPMGVLYIGVTDDLAKRVADTALARLRVSPSVTTAIDWCGLKHSRTSMMPARSSGR